MTQWFRVQYLNTCCKLPLRDEQHCPSSHGKSQKQKQRPPHQRRHARAGNALRQRLKIHRPPKRRCASRIDSRAQPQLPRSHQNAPPRRLLVRPCLDLHRHGRLRHRAHRLPLRATRRKHPPPKKKKKSADGSINTRDTPSSAAATEPTTRTCQPTKSPGPGKLASRTPRASAPSSAPSPTGGSRSGGGTAGCCWGRSQPSQDSCS